MVFTIRPLNLASASPTAQLGCWIQWIPKSVARPTLQKGKKSCSGPSLYTTPCIPYFVCPLYFGPLTSIFQISYWSRRIGRSKVGGSKCRKGRTDAYPIFRCDFRDDITAFLWLTRNTLLTNLIQPFINNRTHINIGWTKVDGTRRALMFRNNWSCGYSKCR